MNLESKLLWIKETYKNYKTDKYLVMKDREGWTDSYIADLLNDGQLIKNAIERKFLKNWYDYRFVTSKENAPSINPIMDKINLSDYSVIDDIAVDLIAANPSLIVRLKSGDKSTAVNPMMIGYFLNTLMGSSLSFHISSDNKSPVLVKFDDAIVGLIMPLNER